MKLTKLKGTSYFEGDCNLCGKESEMRYISEDDETFCDKCAEIVKLKPEKKKTWRQRDRERRKNAVYGWCWFCKARTEMINGKEELKPRADGDFTKIYTAFCKNCEKKVSKYMGKENLILPSP